MRHLRSACAALSLMECGLLLVACNGCGNSTADGLASALDAQAPSAKASLQSESRTLSSSSGNGLAAVRQASEAGKYLFAFFWKDEGEQTAAMRKIFDAAIEKAKDRANAVVIKITDESEKPIIEKFDLARAPMPLVLAIAPSGAIMGGFPTKFTEESLLNSFGSPCTEQCMKTLQDGNLVILCIQNKSTTSNEGAMKGVKEFAADQRYASATKIVMLDPSDPVEKPFLADLKIDPQTPEAITAFMAPPGAVIAEFKGITDKDELIAALQKASTACGPGGCGPGGCSPQK